MLQRPRNHGSIPGRRYILFSKMSIPALPLVQLPVQWYTLQFRSRFVMVVTICVIFMCIVTQTMQFSTAFTTFTLVFSSRPTLIFATLQATTVESVASNTESKLHRRVSRNGPVLKVWPADNYGSCGVLEENRKIFITLKEIGIETKNMLLFLSSVYSFNAPLSTALATSSRFTKSFEVGRN